MCERNETADEQLKRYLVMLVKNKEEAVITLQGEIRYGKMWIKKLEQTHCEHVPQSGDDGAHRYCSKCGKILE